MSLPIEQKSIPYLTSQFHQSGTVVWIGFRPTRAADLQSLPEVNAIAGKGLEGDHYSSKNGKRHVTLTQQEHIVAVASMQGMIEIAPGLLRRNLVVKGLNLLALKDKQFRIGGVLLEYSGLCHPCSRMEENLGDGGYNAMRGHGGITARIIEGGSFKLNDSVVPEIQSTDA